ncbi:hypothetical protein OAX78_00620 [Planctomycetota bacterium]|nr:hypothetical protein [Planctomycetota bacterium]
MALSADTREWLGLTPADAVLWVAFGLLAAGCYVRAPLTVGLLFAGGGALGVPAAVSGMKPNAEATPRTNRVKKSSSIIAIVLMVLIVAGKIGYHVGRG